MRTNNLSKAPPFSVEHALKTLGSNLRRARLRRGLTLAEVAEKIGTGPRPIMEAEKGAPLTGVQVYAALLWAYDLLPSFESLADPLTDEHGLAMASRHEPERARRSKGLDNDF